MTKEQREPTGGKAPPDCIVTAGRRGYVLRPTTTRGRDWINQMWPAIAPPARALELIEVMLDEGLTVVVESKQPRSPKEKIATVRTTRKTTTTVASQTGATGTTS